MSTEHLEKTNLRKFILAAFFGFVAVFSLLMIMMQWHGDYDPGTTDMQAEVSVTEGSNAAPAESAEQMANASDDAINVKVALPGAIQLQARRGGMEDKLVSFLNDPNAKAGKDVWFDFDNINFKTGSAELTEDSYAQVQNIAAVLKAYPKLKVKIGGYTDKTGDSIGNYKLSQARADTVMNALKKMGADANQLTGSEGYGSQYAKMAATASDEERRSDRRIALGIREK